MGSTVIGTGSKIDNFVNIAHNVKIGNHVLVVAQAGICGKVRVGDRSYIGPSSCISQGVCIGEDAFIGLGAFVTQDVASGVSVLGRGVGYLVDRRLRELSLGGSWTPKES
jgi:UDP-3-O-[3-hydroxymyristoyl] glucosamine N-acyltransferase